MMTRAVLSLFMFLILSLVVACAPAATPDRARAPEQEGIYGAPATQSGEDAIEGPVYEWSGTVVASDVESPHLELERGCDAWVLLPQSDETELKLESSIGTRLIVRGKVFPGPTIFNRPAIAAFSAFGADEAVPLPATPAPEYPCAPAPEASPTPTPQIETTPAPVATTEPVNTPEAVATPEQAPSLEETPTATPEASSTPAGEPKPVAEPTAPAEGYGAILSGTEHASCG